MTQNFKQTIRLLLLVVCCISMKAQAQLNFYRNINSGPLDPPIPGNIYSTDEIGRKIVQASTNDYYIISRNTHPSSSPVATFSVITKTNSSGKVLWAKQSDPAQYIRDMKLLSNGNTALALGYDLFSSSSWRVYEILIRNSSLGSIALPSYTFNGTVNGENTYYGSCNAIIESKNVTTGTMDGVVGCGFIKYDNSYGVAVTKHDPVTGSVSFEKLFMFGGVVEQANSVCETEDGGYVITGKSDNNLFVLKLDNSGNYLWSRLYAPPTGSSFDGKVVINYFDGTNNRITVAGQLVDGSSVKTAVLKIDPSGNTLSIQSTTNTTGVINVHSMEKYGSDQLMLSGSRGQGDNYTSVFDYATLGVQSIGADYACDGIFNTIVTNDMCFASTGGAQYSISHFIVKTKGDALVNCLGTATTMAFNSQTYTLVTHTATESSLTHSAANLTFSDIEHDDPVVCCYASGAIKPARTIHAKCNESVTLQPYCDEPQSSITHRWYDESGHVISTSNTFSFTATTTRVIVYKGFNTDGCIYCENTITIVVDPPEICVDFPTVICANQPIVPTYSCDMSNITWHQWVIAESPSDWAHRVNVATVPSSGAPGVINLRDYWNFEPGKCYYISLDVFDACGGSNTNYWHFCIPAVEIADTNLTFCPDAGEDRKWWDPCNFFNDPHFKIINTTGGGSVTEYDSEIGIAYNGGIITGCLGWQFRENETYKIEYYDASGCLLKILNITVSRKAMDETVCVQHIDAICGMEYNPDGYTPNSEACPDCNFTGARVDISPWTVISGGIPGTKTFERTYVDRDNCHRCRLQLVVHYVSQEIVVNYTNVVGCITDLDLSTLMPCLAGALPPAQIIHYSLNNPAVQVLPSHFFTVCCDNPENTLPPSGTHYFEVSMPNGCICRLKINITCVNNPPGAIEPLGLNKLEKINKIQLMPNPTGGKFSIILPEINSAKSYTMQITDNLGRQICSRPIDPLNQKIEVDMGAEPLGIYFIKIFENGIFIYTEKLVLIR